MPDYSFVCEECGAHFTKHLGFNQNRSNLVCPNGHHHIQREYTAPQVNFKGSGFYVTDSKKTDKAA